MPDVLFVCVHNSGRSQMAEAFYNALAEERGLRTRAGSAGTMPGDRVNPQAAEAMKEIGIDLSGAKPKLLTPALARETPRLITMGCGVDAEACPAGTYFSEDWGLDDPAGQDLDTVRQIRDQIRDRVEALLGTVAAANQQS